MKKVGLLTLVLILVVTLLPGCGQSSVADEKFSVTDSKGTVVVIEKIPEKIIALLPSDVEILYALGVQDKLVAVGEYANFPEDVKEKKKLGSGPNTNVEEIINLDPDIVFFGQMEQTEAMVEQLRQAGITVIVSNDQNIEDVYNTIEMMGRITGKSKDAQKIIEDMKAGFAELKEKAAKKDRVRAYIEVSPLQFGLWTCGKGTFIHELSEIVGIENVFAEIEGWGQISEEQVIAKNPDIILTTVGEDYGVEKPVEDILSRETWKGIKAVADGKVYMLDAEMTARPVPRLLDAARDMYRLVYGE